MIGSITSGLDWLTVFANPDAMGIAEAKSAALAAVDCRKLLLFIICFELGTKILSLLRSILFSNVIQFNLVFIFPFGK